ncbi:hypothetical protein KS4_06170 [Poriferisphaera corsica]|uniref:Ice-binding protein C-terminal domain-containing protein n=1 Tax=Poriferisphaera corsica TaxID=2528020 RepID=A0A517YQT9_9BACT|nr:PEP-CTERM sorting domain-containing protein [Poriferisphaera corsica]QDU32583.1 hypothetical protein KS4_06170 [Poriferisphaera corsica]
MKNFITIIIAALSITASASAAKIAITGIHTDTSDNFTFVALQTLEAGTEIYFTDNGANTDGTIYDGEGILLWTASTTVEVGQVVSFDNNNEFTKANNKSFALSTGGDQVLAYTMSGDTKEFLFLAQTNSTQFQSSASNSNVSALAPGLIEGTNAVAAGKDAGSKDEWDNAQYIGTRTGTADELMAAIANTDNWVGSNSSIVLNTEAFTITPIPEPASLSLIALSSLALLRRRK